MIGVPSSFLSASKIREQYSGHQGVDPFAYLRNVLGCLPTQPTDRLDELRPDRWYFDSIPHSDLMKSRDNGVRTI